MIVFIEELKKLRERIEGIDYSITALIAQRVKLALQIGDLKNEQKLPIRNYQVEKQVMKRVASYSTELELDPKVIGQIFRKIVSQSVEAQIAKQQNSETSKRKRPALVIGGLGEMGKWFVKFLLSSGIGVEICDPRVVEDEMNYKDLNMDLNKFELILVCVPLQNIRAVLQELIEKDIRSTIFEIASLKSHILDILKEANRRKINIISIHPMFGPNIIDLSSRNLIVCTGLGEESDQKSAVLDLFKDTMIHIEYVNVHHHDKLMLYTLGLSHFINLLTGLILTKSNIGVQLFSKIAGTTFLNQLKTTREVYQENPALYFHIQRINAYRDELYQEINRSTKELIDIISENSETSFTEIMASGHLFLEGGAIRNNS